MKKGIAYQNDTLIFPVDHYTNIVLLYYYIIKDVKQ